MIAQLCSYVTCGVRRRTHGKHNHLQKNKWKREPILTCIKAIWLPYHPCRTAWDALDVVLSSNPALLSSWKHLSMWEGNLQGKAVPQLLHHSLTSRLLHLGSLVWHCNIKVKYAVWLEVHFGFHQPSISFSEALVMLHTHSETSKPSLP